MFSGSVGSFGLLEDVDTCTDWTRSRGPTPHRTSVAADDRELTSSVDATAYITRPGGVGLTALDRPGCGSADRVLVLTDDRDLIGPANACRAVREVFAQLALKGFVLEEELPGLNVQTYDEWRTHPAHTVLRRPASGGHLSDGGRRRRRRPPPSASPRDCGLRVVDASVMPMVTSGKTDSPTVTYGEKAADLILQSS
jgi:choline dehydrogenase